RLVPPSRDESVTEPAPIVLNDLLQLRRIALQEPVVSNRHRAQLKTEIGPCEAAIQHDWHEMIRIFELEVVRLPGSQEERVNAGQPFVMVAENEIRLINTSELSFSGAEALAGSQSQRHSGIRCAILVIILGYVTEAGIIIQAFQVQTILRCQL